MSFLTKIFGDANEGYLKKLRPQVAKINSLEKTFKSFSDTQLREKSQALKGKIVGGEIVGGEASNILDEVLPEAFALIREAAKRTLNQRHFDVQLIGGMILHQGKIAEMKTGEGKNFDRHLARLLERFNWEGRARGDSQRLSGKKRYGLDGADIQFTWDVYRLYSP